MNDEYTKKLEHVIRQMLQPLRDIPFNIVIENICGFQVIEFDRGDVLHTSLLQQLIEAAKITCKDVNANGIVRDRPNEVGNDIEDFVIQALNSIGVLARKPKAKSGGGKSTGYPDIEIILPSSIKHYIECKTFNIKNKSTSMRSFYVSPCENFKVTHDAIHFIMGFEVFISGRQGSKNVYKTNGWKILDAYHLPCDVKYEFNSDNKRLYDSSMILAEGTV